jgi:hypothetical protein
MSVHSATDNRTDVVPSVQSRTFPIAAIVLGLAVLVGTYAPWYLIGTESSAISISRSIWWTGFSEWGVGNAVLLLGAIVVACGVRALFRWRTTSIAGITYLFLAIFIIAGDEFMSFGEIHGGWTWNLSTQRTGWGLDLILAASTLGAAVSLRWLVVASSRRSLVASFGETEDRPFPPGHSKLLVSTLFVLSVVAIAASFTTWISRNEQLVRTVHVSFRGASSWGVGTIVVILASAIALVCAVDLHRTRALTRVIVASLALANLVVLINFYFAYRHPAFSHEYTVVNLDTGYWVTFAASVFALLVVAYWYVAPRASTNT